MGVNVVAAVVSSVDPWGRVWPAPVFPMGAPVGSRQEFNRVRGTHRPGTVDGGARFGEVPDAHTK